MVIFDFLFMIFYLTPLMKTNPYLLNIALQLILMSSCSHHLKFHLP